MHNKHPFSILVFMLSFWFSQCVHASKNPAPVLAKIHFNTQTADFSAARNFYRLLGYTDGVGNFPKTNTPLMAKSLGMYDLCTYVLDEIEVINMPHVKTSNAIDLIKFKVPFNPEPPYAALNHLGMIYAAFSSADIEQDYAYLEGNGVPFLSPLRGDTGNRFAFFRDPDGVFYKLQESDDKSATATPPHLTQMAYVAFNVSNIEASLKFYQDVGYEQIGEGTTHLLDASTALAYGFDDPIKFSTLEIKATQGDQHRIKLIQWHSHFDPEPPYPAPISHIGIHRIALAVADLDASVNYLSEKGVGFLSEPAPCCSGTGLDKQGIINAIDPDGIFVELVGAIEQRKPQPLPKHCQSQ